MRIAACAADTDLWLPGTEMVASFAEDAGHRVTRICAHKAPRTPDLFHPIYPDFPEGGDGRIRVRRRRRGRA